jgi:hypothetical protein
LQQWANKNHEIYCINRLLNCSPFPQTRCGFLTAMASAVSPFMTATRAKILTACQLQTNRFLLCIFGLTQLRRWSPLSFRHFVLPEFLAVPRFVDALKTAFPAAA